MLAQAALDRYYEEVGAAADPGGRLLAIARVVRSLHVMHLFQDANGRLNVYLLLPRLLLEQGFAPVIHLDMGVMFNGGWSLDRIVGVLRAGQPSTQAWMPASSTAGRPPRDITWNWAAGLPRPGRPAGPVVTIAPGAGRIEPPGDPRARLGDVQRQAAEAERQRDDRGPGRAADALGATRGPAS
jgi:hypothetical protein